MWGHGVLPAALPAPFSAPLSTALLVYLCANVGPQGLLVVRLPAPFIPHSASLGPPWQRESSLPRLPISAPPTGLDECLFFYFLGVGLPCCSIFHQFWLCEEAQCVHLRRHLGSPNVFLSTHLYITLILHNNCHVLLHKWCKSYN